MYVSGSETAAAHLYAKLGSRSFLQGTPIGDFVASLAPEQTDLTLGNAAAVHDQSVSIVNLVASIVGSLPSIGLFSYLAIAIIAVLLVQTFLAERRSSPDMHMEESRILQIVLPSMCMWLLWSVLFNRQYAAHDYEAMLGTPFVSILGGLVTALVVDCALHSGDLFKAQRITVFRFRILIFIGLAILVALPNLPEASKRLQLMRVEYRIESFADFIRANTSPGAVVFVPKHMPTSLIYFSERRIEALSRPEFEKLCTQIARVPSTEQTQIVIALFADDISSYRPLVNLEGTEKSSRTGWIKILDRSSLQCR